ncbi:MAG TPA: glycosyltransferase family 4 protein [Kineosporiaceae bacterium]
MSEPGAVAAVCVPTPWYPVPFNRMAGSFVAEHARLATRLADRVHVVHAQEWPGGAAGSPAVEALRGPFDAVLDRLAAGGGLQVPGATGPVTRVPVFTEGGAGVAQRAEAMVRDVRRAVGPFREPVVHGHVGYWGGLLAARLADPAARVFATEHSTGLRDVLADPAGRAVYAEVLARADRVFCVSGLLRDQILDALPGSEPVLEVLPNPVDFTGVPRRPEPPKSLDQWVFVGSLTERKGVERLVRAFAAVARHDPAVELTLFGDGPLAGRLTEIARDAGVADRLHLRGVVRHVDVLAALPRFDLLLAPSTYETFHLAVVEGVAAGVPVIVTRSGGPQEALAGVEHLVGRFVDVQEGPDALVDAHRELSAALDTLDLDAARAALDARYGPAAIAGRLAAAYGVPAGAVRPTECLPRPEPAREPERIVVLAASGWRRYSVEAELAAARALGAPTVVVTGDPQVTAWAAGLRVVGPAAVAALAGAQTGATPSAPQRSPQPSTQPEPLGVRARRLAGRVRRRLQGRPAAQPPRWATVTAGDVSGATVVVADCQSMPLADRLATAVPQARLVVELARGGRLGPPPDGRDDAP